MTMAVTLATEEDASSEAYRDRIEPIIRKMMEEQGLNILPDMSLTRFMDGAGVLEVRLGLRLTKEQTAEFLTAVRGV